MTEFVFALRRQRRNLTVWSVSVAAYVALIVLVWPSISRSSKAIQDYINSMPKGFTKAFGVTEMSTPAGYLGGELLSVVLPMLMIVAAISFTLAITATYEDAGYFETLLVLPITRTRLILGRGLSALASIVVLALAVYLALAVFGAAVGMHLAQGKLAAAMLCVLALAVMHGAIAYLAAGLGLGRGRALGLAAGIGVLGYAMNTVLTLVHSLEGLAAYSPWHWTLARDPLRAGLPVGGVLLTLAIAAGLVALGTAAFNRRDIHIP